MTTTLSPEDTLRKIQQFAEDAKKRVPRASYRPPVREDFRPAQILCFDQTLSHCGWAILATDQAEISILATGVVSPTVGQHDRGFAATFAKSIQVADGMEAIIRDNYGSFEEVVAEMPAVAGYRTESSLVAAVILVRTLNELGEPIPTFISRNQAGAVLCGDPQASKVVSGRLVDGLVGDRHPRPWNEHVRDAVFVGLQRLHKGL